MSSKIASFVETLKTIGWDFTTNGKMVHFTMPQADHKTAIERVEWVANLLKSQTGVVAFFKMLYWSAPFGTAGRKLLSHIYRPSVKGFIEYDAETMETGEGGAISDNQKDTNHETETDN